MDLLVRQRRDPLPVRSGRQLQQRARPCRPGRATLAEQVELAAQLVRETGLVADPVPT